MNKPQPPTITSITEFPEAVTYGSFDYPLPTLGKKPPTNHVINELPSFQERPAAIWKADLPLGSTFFESLYGTDTSRSSSDSQDPAMKIVISKRKNAKTFKLGSMIIDITKLNNSANASTNTLGSTKLVNKFLQKDTLVNSTTTPMKRNRDEIVEASSSVKKNRRMQELQADTTMELSFEGKAMDKSDLVKLVDSSGFMQDDSHLPDYDNSMVQNVDTRNLLQNAEFNFEYKRV